MVSTLSSTRLDELLGASLFLILVLLPHQGTYPISVYFIRDWTTRVSINSDPFCPYNWSHLVNSFVFTFLICKTGVQTILSPGVVMSLQGDKNIVTLVCSTCAQSQFSELPILLWLLGMTSCPFT